MNPKKAASECLKATSGHDSQRCRNGEGVEHARWMLFGVAEGYIENEKAHRWLGYAQGLLVQDGCVTLSQMKTINMVSQ